MLTLGYLLCVSCLLRDRLLLPCCAVCMEDRLESDLELSLMFIDTYLQLYTRHLTALRHELELVTIGPFRPFVVVPRELEQVGLS